MDAISKPYTKDRSRYYPVEGSEKDLPSVTTLLSAVSKPALVPWAAKQERLLVAEIAKEVSAIGYNRGEDGLFATSLDARLKQTKYACFTKLEDAGEIGTDIHAAVECAIKGQPIPEMRAEVKTGFDAWKRWRDEVDLEVLMCEQRLYSLQYSFAGTADFIGRGYFYNQTPEAKTKTLVLGDNKSSKGLYYEHLLQLAAYRHAVREMGHFTDERVDGLVVKIPKTIKDGTVQAFFVTSEELDDHFKTFLAVRDLWVGMKKFESDKRYR